MNLTNKHTHEKRFENGIDGGAVSIRLTASAQRAEHGKNGVDTDAESDRLRLPLQHKVFNQKKRLG